MTTISRFVRNILPPFWFLIAIAAQIALHLWMPLARGSSAPLSLLGCIVMLLGILLVLSAANCFRAVGTPMKPFSNSTVLVRDGAYRYTRNPMYLGMMVMLGGAALALQSLSTIFPILLFFLVIDRGYVRAEEEFLIEIFGEPYRQLQREVPRWLGPVG